MCARAQIGGNLVAAASGSHGPDASVKDNGLLAMASPYAKAKNAPGWCLQLSKATRMASHSSSVEAP